MNKDTLNKILKFRGDIASSFEFLMSVYSGIGFQLQTNLDAISKPYDTFSNAIRSYRQKGLLFPVDKNGVKLILSGINIIQYLLIQRFLPIGVKLEDLKNNLPDMTSEHLQYLILTKDLSLNDISVTLSNNKEIKQHAPKVSVSTKDIKALYAIEVSRGLHLVFSENIYSIDDAKRIGKLIIKTIGKDEIITYN